MPKKIASFDDHLTSSIVNKCVQVVALGREVCCCMQVSWVQPRVLTLEQAAGLQARLGGWITKVNKASSTLEEQRLGALE